MKERGLDWQLENEMNGRNSLAFGLVVACAILAGCGAPQGESVASNKERPSRLMPAPGTNVIQVVLTAEAAARLGIKIEAVRKSSTPGAGASNTVVPTGAIVYDAQGGSWVYVAVAGSATDAAGLPLSYVRQAITVARIDGNVAVLSASPAPGTDVVTVGADELLGTEYGVEGN